MDARMSSRLASEPWDFPVGGDHLIYDPAINSTVQTVELSPKTATGGNRTNTGSYNFANNWRGNMKVFTTLAEPDWVPSGCKIWIDDIVVKQYELYTTDFDVLNVPATLLVGESRQLSIGNIIPTHAPSRVGFDVIDGSGQASIDETGLLTGVAKGTVTVKVISEDGRVIKDIPVTITGGVSINGIDKEAVYLYPSAVKQGESIKINGIKLAANIQIYNLSGALVTVKNSKTIETNRLTPGVYIVKIKDEGTVVLRKFVVKD
jgi:hypothetical protein